MPPEFGATPWGKAWVRTIEPTTVTAPNPLLPKARSLARNNAVTTLHTQPGCVEAEVLVRGVPHQVRIDLPLWDAKQEAEAERLITEALVNSPGLASGDLPDALEADLSRRGIPIATSDQASDCTCPTRRNPCAHILATVYALAQRIDEHPTLAISLRASSRESTVDTGRDWISLTHINTAHFYGTGAPGAKRTYQEGNS
jgi:uncharacterized Zn finger protein